MRYVNASPQQRESFIDTLDANSMPQLVLILDCCTQ